MPRSSAPSFDPPPVAVDASSTVAVTSVVRAMALLGCFALDEPELGLVTLSARVGLHKTTVLRLARTLAIGGYMVQTGRGTWRLGPAAGWLGVCYQSGFNVRNAVEPLLRALAQETGESAAFYVREGRLRSCVARVEGANPYPQHARIGEAFPLELGSPGTVILAFSGEPGALYDTIRARGFHATQGGRVADVATVSAPVFGLGWKLLGSVCVSGPSDRLTDRRLADLAGDVMRIARRLSHEIAGSAGGPGPLVPSLWHPAAARTGGGSG